MHDAPVGGVITPMVLGSVLVVPKKSLFSYQNR